MTLLEMHGGLSSFGKEVISKMNQLGYNGGYKSYFR